MRKVENMRRYMADKAHDFLAQGGVKTPCKVLTYWILDRESKKMTLHGTLDLEGCSRHREERALEKAAGLRWCRV